ncbi:glycoside hydrolase family 127 protein [Sinomonas albida]|uniref:glycoside hydrolase family 127 protein n=1 Tax=Sinomonas albida TaxID=369942 RepID=UPI003018EE6F
MTSDQLNEVAAPRLATSDQQFQGPVGATASGRYTLRPLPFDAVRLSGAGHLGAWQELNRTATIPHCIASVEASGGLDNFRRLIGESDTGFKGYRFQDSDLYKTIEAVGWESGRTGEAPWSDYLAEVGRLLDKVQEPDGYLNTWVQGNESESRWTRLEWSHELYTAGHLLQAAVAIARSTGDTIIPAAALRVADLIVETFGEGGLDMVDGHPEVETALVELYRLTGEKKYLDAANRQLELRGRGLLPEDRFGSQYFQDHLPIREAAHEATGHAVRQIYLAAGIVDVYLENGDKSLLEAAESLWHSVFGHKAYLTGALGSRHRDEAFGDPYELPSDRAYAETCASIASFHWNWRLLLATGNGKYAEEMERALYNAIAVSTSEAGTSFFYSNPLQLRTGHDGSTEDAPSERLPWYACACCPPNLARLVASLHSYVASQDAEGVQLHLYGDGELRFDSSSAGIATLRTETRYPWDEQVNVSVEAGPGEWTLALRIPAWCQDASVLVDGAAVSARPDASGYVRIRRNWEGTTTVSLQLPMPARIVSANPRIDAVRGAVALAKGPVIYCLEQHDQEPGVLLEDLRIDPAGEIREVPAEGLSGGFTMLKAPGKRVAPATAALYADAPTPLEGEGRPVELTAIPYFRWANRGEGAMRVWIPTA